MEVRRLKEISNTISLFRRFIPENDITWSYYKNLKTTGGIKVLKKWGVGGDSEDGPFLSSRLLSLDFIFRLAESNIFKTRSLLPDHAWYI